MIKPAHVVEIFLQPGDFYFGDRNTRIRTLLGSCISIAMWHPHKRIGGMCHYMLPSRNSRKIQNLNGRYGDEAILMFFKEAVRNETDPNDYVVKVFGGGNMFLKPKSLAPCVDKPCGDVISGCRNVSCKNVVLGLALLENYGFAVEAQDLGGNTSRNIIFDIWSGHVWVRQNPLMISSGKKAPT